MLSRTLLNELKQILQEDYNLLLTDEEVAKLGNNLVGYFTLLAKIQNRIQSNENNQP
jgi:hypothetical protein